jgi:hypothetical protein
MALKTFGELPKNAQDYIDDIYGLVGCNFPITIYMFDGQLTAINYETEWQEGATEPIEKSGKVVSYKQNYANKALTASQIAKIDEYIQKNLVL